MWNPIAKHIIDWRSPEDAPSGTRAALTALSLYYRGVADLGDDLDARAARKT